MFVCKDVSEKERETDGEGEQLLHQPAIQLNLTTRRMSSKDNVGSMSENRVKSPLCGYFFLALRERRKQLKLKE